MGNDWIDTHDMEAVNGFRIHLEVGTRTQNSDRVVRVFSNIIIHINAYHRHRIYKKHIPSFITIAIPYTPSGYDSHVAYPLVPLLLHLLH